MGIRTDQQQTFIDAVLAAVKSGGGKHFCLRARAGTGKSYTVLELVDDYAKLYPKHEVSLCAFNKSAATELKEKLIARGHTGKNVAAATVHSLGLSILRYPFNPKVNGNKVRDLIDSQNEPVYQSHGALIAKLVSFAKLEGFGFFGDCQIGDVSAWYRIAEHYDINGFDDTTEMDRVVEAAQHIYTRSLQRTDEVDFDDMILFPLIKNIRVKWQKDLLVVDECFLGDTPVLTSKNGAWKTIGEIVETGYRGPVVTWDKTRGVVMGRVTGHKRVLRSKPMKQIRFAQKRPGRNYNWVGRSIVVCTEDHQIKTSRGWTAAGKLRAGETVFMETAQARVRQYQQKHKISARGKQSLSASLQGNTRGNNAGGGNPQTFAAIKGGNGRVVEAEVVSVEDYATEDQYVYDIEVAGTNCYFAHGLLVHNCQDTGRARQALITKFVKLKGTLVVVGDDCQCQPTGTTVYATGRGEVPIETLKVGDKLLTYSNGFFPGKGGSPHPKARDQGRKIEAITSRPYNGTLIKISAGGKEHEVTPNHRCLVRMTDRPGSVVYVMRSGNHARVGRCSSKHGGDFGLSGRGRQERADAVWAIKFFPQGKEREAQLLEMTLAYLYGLPQTCFHYGWTEGLPPTQRARFWQQYPSNIEGLERCLEAYGLLMDYPFWEKGDAAKKHSQTTKHIGSKYSFILPAINLFDGWMKVCLFEGDQHKPRWAVAKISRRHYKGKVWSLKVQPTENGRRLYVSQGIVTHNSIYAFAGAQADALDQLITQFSMTVYPLTVCWRCPKNVIKVAQAFVPDIEWAPNAAEGTVTTAEVLPDVMNPTDAILCRNTAPLIEAAYLLLRRGVACKVEGREIGTGLLTLVNRWKRATTIDAFLKRLEDYREREVQKALAKKKESKAAEVNDRCDTLVHLCNACIAKKQTSLDDLRAFIDSIFADDVKGVVTLSTLHKSKGKEWPRVFLLQFHQLCPSKWAKQPWQLQQERNLMYVGVTRAAGELVYVDPPLKPIGKNQ